MRFPGLVVVDGPACAGDDDGRVFAVDEGGVVYLRDDGQIGPTLSSFGPRDRLQLSRHSPSSQMLFPRRDDDGGGWLHVRHADDVVALDDGAELVCGPRRLRLDGDVGAVVRARRVGGRVVVRPRGPWPLGLLPQSLWTLADDPAHDVLVSGDVAIEDFARRLRHVGVALDEFGGRVDARVARALAKSTRSERTLGRAGVTFDGVVVAGVGLTIDVEVFAALTADSGGDFAGPVADAEEVSAFVRSFDPRGWARERLFREECAVAA